MGLIQPQMAEELAISRSYYSKIEIGVNAPNDTLIELVCQKYHVRKPWLLSGDGDTYERHDPPAALAVEEPTEAYRVAPGKLRDAIRIIADQMEVTEDRAACVLGRVIAEIDKEC
jgi:transcriptional regulator with XRE-family HTH domain